MYRWKNTIDVHKNGVTKGSLASVVIADAEAEDSIHIHRYAIVSVTYP